MRKVSLLILLTASIAACVAGKGIVERTLDYVDENTAYMDECLVVAMAGMEGATPTSRYLREQIASNRALATAMIVEIAGTDKVVAELLQRIIALEKEVERLKGKRT